MNMSTNKQFPWLGVALIVSSLFLPYISVMGIWEFSGFEILRTIGDLMTVMGIDDGSGSGIANQADASLAGDELKKRLKEDLSAYKVPRHYFFRTKENIPFTDSGKVDKKKLIVLLTEALEGVVIEVSL